jgi:hypothetical protein
MKLKIITISERGIPYKERLHLKVLAQADLSFYAVLGTTKTSATEILTNAKHFYWWGNYLVNAGDSVILYSGPGNNSAEVRPDGKKNHFFYWGLPNVIWLAPNSCAVVLELANWETSP